MKHGSRFRRLWTATLLACALVLSVASAHAAVRTLTLQSSVLARSMDMNVYLPQGFDEGKRYPVLYLLHGEKGDAKEWGSKTSLEAKSSKYGMIVVTPDGNGNSWYLDSPLVPANRYETFFTQELVPFVDAQLPTVKESKGRGISGYSMGGNGAFALAVKHPDLFSSTSSISGNMDLRRLNANKDLIKLLGTLDKAPKVWAAVNPVSLAMTGEVPKGMAIYTVCGTEDAASIAANRDLHTALGLAGISNSFVEHPGKHDWNFAAARLEEILLFHSIQFAKQLNIPASPKPQGELITLQSKALKQETKFYVLKPRTYNPDRKYPVLYLLHGAWGSYVDWYNNTNLINYLADLDMLVVTPDGSYFPTYIDSPYMENSQYETFLTKELVSYIDSNYPTLATPGTRGICGLSMGGHGAITLGIKHPEVYGSASSLSGILDIYRHPTDWEINKKLGTKAKNDALWKGNSALWMALDKRIPTGMPLMVSCGMDDFAYPEDLDFHRTLQIMGIPHTFAEHPGAHDWTYWDTHIREHLIFHGTIFAKATETK